MGQCILLYVYVHICMCVCICVCVCVYIYIHACMYICTHAYVSLRQAPDAAGGFGAVYFGKLKTRITDDESKDVVVKVRYLS